MTAVFPHRVCAREKDWVGEYTMVRFVDHLATGKTLASFFKSFPSPKMDQRKI